MVQHHLKQASEYFAMATSEPDRRDDHIRAGFDDVSSHRNGLGNSDYLTGVRNRSLHSWHLRSQEAMRNIVGLREAFAFLKQRADNLSFPAPVSSATNPQNWSRGDVGIRVADYIANSAIFRA